MPEPRVLTDEETDNYFSLPFNPEEADPWEGRLHATALHHRTRAEQAERERDRMRILLERQTQEHGAMQRRARVAESDAVVRGRITDGVIYVRDELALRLAAEVAKLKHKLTRAENERAYFIAGLTCGEGAGCTACAVIREEAEAWEHEDTRPIHDRVVKLVAENKRLREHVDRGEHALRQEIAKRSQYETDLAVLKHQLTYGYGRTDG